MRKTFEDLIFEETNSQSDGWCTTYLFSDVLKLMKLVREKTLEEAERFIKIEDFGYSTNKKELLTLDKNSIQL